MAPVNKPMNPESMKPPIAPRKIINIGTGAPLPKRMGLSTLSDNEASIISTAQTVAMVAEVDEYK